MSQKPRVGIVLAVDGEKEYTAALSRANAENQKLKSEMSLLKQQFDGQQNSMDAISARLKKLKEQQGAYTASLKASKDGQKNAADAVSHWRGEIDKTKSQIDQTEKKMEELEKTVGKNSDAYREQEKELANANEQLKKQESYLQKAETSQARWSSRVANAEKNLEKCNADIKKEEQYLEEAKRSSDNCATSIDSMGKKAKNSGEEMKTFGSTAETAMGTMVGVVAGGVITKGLEKLGEAAKKAAQYSVEVGSEFEKSMSKVQALSGAAGDYLTKLSEKAQTLGRSTQYSASQVADAMANMALAGWTTEQTLNGIDGVLQLAAASGMDLAAAADAVAGYLAAFNMEADESSRLADMMATAQAKSKTTADQLAEAYSTSATNLTQAGQAAETTTALLEGLASVNDTGSAAGTKLSAVMAQITQKMKDGAIEIGKASVAVKDENGNFRDMIDIVEDVEKATAGLGDAERAAALQKTFNRQSTAGMNELLAVGSEQLRKYRTELENSTGAAETMAQTMNDNLKGDLAAFGSATEGLGIAVFDYLDGPARQIVQGATTAINAISDALKPQEDALRDFIGGIEETNKKISDMIDAGDEVLSVNEDTIARLEAYKDILVESAGATENDAFQKYQLQRIIDELGADIPELTEAWDAQNGVLDLSKEKVAALMEEYENTIQQKAWLDAMTQYQSAYTEAVVQSAIAQSAQQTATEKLTEAQNAYAEAKGQGLSAEWDAMQAQKSATENQQAATRAAIDAADAEEEAKGKLEQAKKAYEEFGGTAEKAAASQDELAGSSDELADAQGGLSESAQEVSEEVQKAYDAMYQSIKSAIDSSLSVFKEFSGGQEVTAQEVLDNLSSQIVGVSNWAVNMATLAREGGENFTQEFYDYLAGMGPESANLVQMLVDTLHDDKDKFDEIAVAWADSLNLQNQATDLVAGATQAAKDAGAAWNEEMSSAAEVSNEEGLGAGKEYVYTWKKGVEDNADQMSEAAKTATQDAVDAAAEESDGYETAGGEAAEKYADGYAGSSDEITDAVRQSVDDAATAGGEKVSQFETLGKNISAGVASGVTSNSKLIQDAVRSALQKALEAGQDELEVHSPSKVFRDEIGRWIPAGVAEGIIKNTTAVTTAATSMSKAALTASTAWLKSYRDEVKSLTSSPVSAVLQTQIDKGFGVDRYTTEKTDTGIVEVLKDQEKYLSEYVSAAKKHLSNYNVIYNASLEEQREYWREVKQHLKSGTQAYYDTVAEIKSLNEQIKDEEARALADRLTSQETYVKHRKILNTMSTEQELEYWQDRIKVYKRYSDEWYTVTEKISGLKEQAAREQQAVFDALSTKDKINALKSENAQLVALLTNGHQTAQRAAALSSQIEANSQKVHDLTLQQQKEALSDWEAYINRKNILNGEDFVNELAFWQSKIKTLDKSGDAYLTVYQRIQTIQEQIVKQRAQYYAQIVSDAEDHIYRQRVLYGMSEEQELEYWQDVIQNLDQKSEEYVKVYEKISRLTESIKGKEDDIARADENRLKNRINIQTRLLSRYKTYYQMSAKAEMEYWDKARQIYAQGSSERIDADSQYLQAAQRYYDELERLAEDYRDKQKKIDDDLAAGVKKLTDDYEKAVEDRKKAILSGMNLWSAYDTEGFTSEELLANMQTQTDALKLYAREWEALVAKGLPQELLKEIEAMGTSATANIYSLNRMTDDDLEKWVALWKEKQDIAERQARIDSQDLLAEARGTVGTLTQDAQDAYRRIVDDYKAGVEEISAAIPRELEAELEAIADASGQYLEAQVDAAVARMQEGISVLANAVDLGVAPSTQDYAGLYSETRAAEYMSELSSILSDSELTQLVDEQRAVYQELADVSDRLLTEWQAGIESLNSLVGITAGGQQVQAQDTRQLELLANILDALERIGRSGTAGNVILDSGALVGAIYPEISELAAEKTQQITRTQR